MWVLIDLLSVRLCLLLEMPPHGADRLSPVLPAPAPSIACPPGCGDFQLLEGLGCTAGMWQSALQVALPQEYPDTRAWSVCQVVGALEVGIYWPM